MTEDRDFGLIGKQVPRGAIRAKPLRVLSLLPLSTIEDGQVKAPSATMPYGVLTVALTLDTAEGPRSGTAMLPITHRDDYRAIHWVLNESDWPASLEVWVADSPAGGLLGSMKASLEIWMSDGENTKRVKGPQEKLDL